MAGKDSKLKKKLCTFFSQDKGTVAIITGLVIVICIGFAALAIDVSVWYSEKRKLQMAATAGAVGGALALSKSGPASIVPNVTHDVNLNGCTADNNCTIVAINNPPLSGPKAGDSNSVEVILSKPAELYLSGLFLGSAPTIQARSVAGQSSGGNCIVALAETGQAVNVVGGASYLANACGLYINSPADNALTVAGTASINITDGSINVVGGVSSPGGATINPTPTTGVSPLSDPHSGTSFPTPPASCDQTNYSRTGGSATINPGVYCGGIALTGLSQLTMQPGVYFLVNQGNVPGDFTATAQTTINGTGVTIILTKQASGTNYGEVSFAGGTTVTLSAPTTGDTAGFLFYGDINAPSSTSHSLTGGSGQLLSGVGYFPSSHVTYSGSTLGAGAPCFQLVARTVTLAGGPSSFSDCEQTTGGGLALFE